MKLLPELFLLLSLVLIADAANNISHILQGHPDYTTFSSLCTKYGVASQINSRQTITVFVPSNAVLDPVLQSSSYSAQTMFDILGYHVILDYYDLQKLKDMTNGTVEAATLYQTTGIAKGNEGFLNITYEHGAAHVGPQGSPLKAVVGTEIFTNPYNISVLSLSALLMPPGAVGAPAPAPAPVNFTAVLTQTKNYGTFLSLLKKTGVDVVLEKHDMPPGLTLFAPDDAAFSKLKSGVLGNLSNAQLVALLEFHAIGSYYGSQELSSLTGPQQTLASGAGGGNYQYSGVSQPKGGSVSINTGFNTVPVIATLYSQEPVAVFGISSVLLPTDIFGVAPTSAPTPSPASSPSPSPASSSSPSPVPATSPTPILAPSSSTSPPAPPLGSPGSPTGSALSPEKSANHAALHRIAFGLVAALQLGVTLLFV